MSWREIFYFVGLLLFTLLLGILQMIMIKQVNATGLQGKLAYFGGGFRKFFRIQKLHKTYFPKSWLRVAMWTLTVLAWIFALRFPHR